jgi:glycosyltransferase involved in cell wall biosynthesis
VPDGTLDVTVIAPARNAAAHLPELLHALTQQTLARERFEVLIADDGSTDGSTDGLETRDGWLRVLRGRPENPYAARNRAARAARGPVLAFCDADCRPDPTWLERGLEALAHADLAAGSVLFLPPARLTVWALVDTETFLDQERAVRAGRAVTANLFVPRTLFERQGGFDGSLANGGDHEFVQRCTRNGARLTYAPDARVWHPMRASARDFLGKVWTVNRRHGIRESRTGRRPSGMRVLGWIPLVQPLRNRVGAGRPLGLDPRRLHASGVATTLWDRLRALPVMYLVIPYVGAAAQAVGFWQGRFQRSSRGSQRGTGGGGIRQHAER